MESPVITKFDSKEERLELYNLVKGLTDRERNDLNFNFNSKTLTFYKMSLEDKIIGIMMVELGDYRCEDFRRFIFPDYRSKGYGKLFIDYLKQELPEKIKNIVGFVKEDNLKGKKFLESQGFTFRSKLGDMTHYIFKR